MSSDSGGVASLFGQFGPLIAGGLGSMFGGPLGGTLGSLAGGFLFSPPDSTATADAGGSASSSSNPLGAVGAIFGNLLGGLLGGPGAGAQRRAAARAAVNSNQALSQLRARVLASVPLGRAAPSTQLIQLVQQYGSVLAPVIAKAQQYGGLGKAYGVQANELQDVVKYVLGGESHQPKRYVPTLADLQSWVGQTTPVGVAAGAGGAMRYASAQPTYGYSGGSYWSGRAYQPIFA